MWSWYVVDEENNISSKHQMYFTQWSTEQLKGLPETRLQMNVNVADTFATSTLWGDDMSVLRQLVALPPWGRKINYCRFKYYRKKNLTLTLHSKWTISSPQSVSFVCGNEFSWHGLVQHSASTTGKACWDAFQSEPTVYSHCSILEGRPY